MSKLDLKRKAVEYYNKNGVPKQFEVLLNEMFIHQPEDLYGYMAEFFEKSAKEPLITVLNCRPSISSQGYEKLTVSVTCCIKGKHKAIYDLQTFADNQPWKDFSRMKSGTARPVASSKLDSKNTKRKEYQTEVHKSNENTITYCFNFEKFSQLLQEELLPSIIGKEVSDQVTIDGYIKTLISTLVTKEGNMKIPVVVSTTDPIGSHQSSSKITSIDHPTEERETICSLAIDSFPAELNMACLTTSLVASLSAAHLKGIPFYKYASLLQNGFCNEFELPVPLLPLATCDVFSPGKLRMFKEILVSPKPHLNIQQATSLLVSFIRCFEESVIAKHAAAGSIRNHRGVLTPPCDKPEQILDLIINIAAFSEHFDLTLNVNADSIYDKEKNKYEIFAGTYKTSAEMVNLYISWLQQYSVVSLVDPLAKQDAIGQQALFTSLSHQCYISLDCLNWTSKEIVQTTQDNPLFNNLVFYPFDVCATHTDLMELNQRVRDCGVQRIIADKWIDVSNATLLVELAIALNAQFLRIDPLSFGGSVSLNSLMRCHQDLCNENIVIEKKSYVFARQQVDYLETANGGLTHETDSEAQSIEVFVDDINENVGVSS